MRYDDHRTVFLYGIYTVLDLLRSYGVKACRRLVKEYHRRILEEHTGNGYALLLTSRKVRGLIAELLRQSHYLVIYASLTGCLHHLVMRGIGLSVKDILLDGTVKYMVFLKHQTYVVTQIFGVIFTQVNAIKGNGSGLRLVELVQQVHNGTLTGTGQAHQRGNPARLYGHIHPKQGFVTVRIGKVHTCKPELTPYLFRTVCARRLHLRVRIQYVKETFGVDKGIVNIVKYTLQLCYGGYHVAEQHDVVHNLTYRHSRIVYQHQICGKYDYKYGAHLFDKTFQAAVIEAYLTGLELVLSNLVLQVKLLAPLYVLAVERFDYVYGIYYVLYTLALGFQIAAHLTAPALEPACLPVGNPEIYRHNAHSHKTYIDIGREHEYQSQQGACKHGQQVYEEVLHRS